MNHGPPHGGPGESDDGKRYEAAVERYVRYDYSAVQVSEKAAKHCAGEHERRVQGPVGFRYDFTGQCAAARAGRSERTPEHRNRR